MKKWFLTGILLLLFCSLLHSQELNGIWKGTLTQQSGGCFPVYNIELQINIEGTAVNGVSYHYSDVTNYVKKSFKGSYDPALKKIFIKEQNVLTFHIPVDCTPCVKNYELLYSNHEKKEILDGSWTGKVVNTVTDCQPGNIELSRIKESAFKDIPEIGVDTGTIRLDFYDNGIIDGDSISVYANKKLLASHQRLGVHPITLFVKVDLTTLYQEIEMVAENLGTIPPNTALLIVTAGKKRYRLSLTSTEQKSAMVRFIYDASLSTAH